MRHDLTKNVSQIQQVEVKKTRKINNHLIKKENS